jgi:uncharacterized Zn-binding protein involved in type VI secretion
LGDTHICPMWSGTVPHVGGPVLPACGPDVLIMGIPVALPGDTRFLRRLAISLWEVWFDPG